VIADDHPVFRFGLAAMLESEADIESVGQATDGEQAVELVDALKPDVVLMDINMPGLNGIEATRRILRSNPDIGILIITMFDDDSLFAAMRAGARGYLLKGASSEEILRGIRAVSECRAASHHIFRFARIYGRDDDISGIERTRGGGVESHRGRTYE
jgi:DNA-binding NarL/FixJ family response regulator